MTKKIEKLFKSYREQLLHLGKLYGVVLTSHIKKIPTSRQLKHGLDSSNFKLNKEYSTTISS